MSNIEVNSGDSVNISGVSTVATTTSVSQPSVNVSVQGISGGSDAHFTYTQNAASDTWSIAHNLGKKPSVTIVDSADSVLYGSIEYTDLNNLTINLSAPTSGKAYLN